MKQYRRRQRATMGQRMVRIGLVLIILWCLGFAGYLAAIPLPPRYGTVDKEEADAIVVLTGGAERLQEGLRLLSAHRAQKLFLTGVMQGVTLDHIFSSTEIMPALRPDRDTVKCCIELGYEAGNTIGNADETALWLAERGYSSIFLVTANYHMNRALLEFRTALPWIKIIPHPAFPEEVLDRYWFVKPRILSLLVNEYNKYLAALSRHAWLSLKGARG